MTTETMNQATMFPENWDIPFDDGEAFFFDPMHHPHPVSPLTASAHGPAVAAGATTAAREQQSLIQKLQVRYRNHYGYTRRVMVQPATDEEAREMVDAAEATARAEIRRLLDRWYGEHLPRITAHHERLRALAIQGATEAELIPILDEVDAVNRDLWTIHFRIATPMLVAIQLFDELYADLFGGAEGDAHALLTGSVSESVKAGFGLSDLAATARELGLGPIIRETPSHELLTVLQDSEEGRAFLAKLDAYLEEYGLRQDLFEYATPTWQEDPSFALSSIRSYVVTERDARAEHAAMARSAEAALQAARERLAAYPEAVRNEFEAMVQFARQGAFLQEEHNFYIDQRGIALLRLFYLRVGARLVDVGLLAAPDEVFMLTGDELRSIVTDLEDARAPGRVRALVQARRDEMEQAEGLTPPPFIGPPQAGHLPAPTPWSAPWAVFGGGRPSMRIRPASSRAMPGRGAWPPALRGSPAPWKRPRPCFRGRFWSR